MKSPCYKKVQGTAVYPECFSRRVARHASSAAFPSQAPSRHSLLFFRCVQNGLLFSMVYAFRFGQALCFDIDMNCPGGRIGLSNEKPFLGLLRERFIEDRPNYRRNTPSHPAANRTLAGRRIRSRSGQHSAGSRLAIPTRPNRWRTRSRHANRIRRTSAPGRTGPRKTESRLRQTRLAHRTSRHATQIDARIQTSSPQIATRPIRTANGKTRIRRTWHCRTTTR